MTMHPGKTSLSEGSGNACSEHHVSEVRGAGDRLLIEYQQLQDEYAILKKRFELLTKEKNSLETQLSETGRSLDLSTRIDPMTGLANRRDIMEKLERELYRCERHQRKFSVMLVNLDDFKFVNDTYGYNHGDDVLVEAALVLKGCVRTEDVCARWGGDEFLMLLTETDIVGALILARRVLDSISMTEFKVNRPGIRVTASVGLCECQAAGQSVYDCISRVDQALRQAKQEGKNRLVVAS
jgi:diguanylate cyclase (GGDEF)-like protein